MTEETKEYITFEQIKADGIEQLGEEKVEEILERPQNTLEKALLGFLLGYFELVVPKTAKINEFMLVGFLYNKDFFERYKEIFNNPIYWQCCGEVGCATFNALLDIAESDFPDIAAEFIKTNKSHSN